MTHILFICLGNICRSVTAEEIFKDKLIRANLKNLFYVDSAGLLNYHEGELADERMRRHANNRGYKLTHRSRPIKTEDFEKFDLIFAMDQQNIKGLSQIAPHPELMKKVKLLSNWLTQHQTSSIPDPYYGDEKDFELVLDLLEDACDNLLNTLTNTTKDCE